MPDFPTNTPAKTAKVKAKAKPKLKRKPITKESQDRRTLAWRRKSSYTIWYNIILRCTDQEHKAYADYGGRGIKVQEDWIPSSSRPYAEAFRNFIRDVGIRPNQKLSLDRIEANGNYEKDNVRWADDFVQARNKRKSVYLPDPKDPQKLIPAAELAERLGIRYQTLRYRYQRLNKWPTDMVESEKVTVVTERILKTGFRHT